MIWAGLAAGYVGIVALLQFERVTEVSDQVIATRTVLRFDSLDITLAMLTTFLLATIVFRILFALFNIERALRRREGLGRP